MSGVRQNDIVKKPQLTVKLLIFWSLVKISIYHNSMII